MRTIRKSAEPRALAEHRSSPYASYENFAGKDVLRNALVAEQHGLCCYCMSRIGPTSHQMKIAHWHSQSAHPDEQLDYRNLLGACRGNQGQPPKIQHCDTSQRDRDISRNPANPTHHVEALIRYRSDGTIASADAAFDRELNEVLNLNVPFLKNNRKAVLDGFKETLLRRGQLQHDTLERWVRDWDGESDTDELNPFCQVVVYWLRKRLRRN